MAVVLNVGNLFSSLLQHPSRNCLSIYDTSVLFVGFTVINTPITSGTLFARLPDRTEAYLSCSKNILGPLHVTKQTTQ
jgi:hypothetical protein